MLCGVRSCYQNMPREHFTRQFPLATTTQRKQAILLLSCSCYLPAFDGHVLARQLLEHHGGLLPVSCPPKWMNMAALARLPAWRGWGSTGANAARAPSTFDASYMLLVCDVRKSDIFVVPVKLNLDGITTIYLKYLWYPFFFFSQIWGLLLDRN